MKHRGTASIDERTLAHLVPLNGLSGIHRRQLAERAKLIELGAGEPIEPGYEDGGHTFYLLEGELEFYTGEERTNRLSAGSEAARFPLSQLGSRQMSARAGTGARLLRVDQSLVDTLLVWAQASIQASIEASMEPPAGGRPTGEATEAAGEWLPRLFESELFRRIPAANADKIFNLMQPVPAKAGATVVQQGERGDYYYVVCEGRCEVVRSPAEGRPPVRLAELQAGDTFGEEALLSDATRNATVRMLTDGRLMRLTKNDFIELIKTPMVNSVTRAEAAELVHGGAIWLDVRLPEEHQHDALEGSVNIPLAAIRTHARTLDRSRTYVVYSNSGRRGAAGAFLLNERGLNARVLEGGLHGPRQSGREEAHRGARRTTSRAAREAPPGKTLTGDATTLRRKLAQADATLQEAFQQKATATLQRRVMADELAGAFDEQAAQAKDEKTREASRQRAEDLRRLEAESDRASEVLRVAQRRKLEIEASIRATDA